MPSALRPRGLGVRTESKFLFQVQADFSAERHSPSCTRSRQDRYQIRRPTHPPFFKQCQAALRVRVHSTTVFRFRYPRPSGLAEFLVLYEAILADDDVETARYQYDLLGRGTDSSDIQMYMFPTVSSRASFSARPLSDVAVSRVPSVAAAAGFLYSLSCRSRVWLRRSALVPKSGHDSSSGSTFSCRSHLTSVCCKAGCTRMLVPSMSLL